MVVRTSRLVRAALAGFAWAAALLLAAAPATAEEPVKRTILALYDSINEGPVPITRIHRLAEFPLNHLGLVVRYHDVTQPLPPVSTLGDVRGVLTWFDTEAIDNPLIYIGWASALLDKGVRFVIIQDLAPRTDRRGRAVPLEVLNRFLAKIGLSHGGDWHTVTYNAEPVIMDPEMVGFERQLPPALPAYGDVKSIGMNPRVHLAVRRNGDPATDAHVIVTTDRGGYAGAGFIDFADSDETKRQWFLNPFKFFASAFETGDLPRPDTNTLSGRRIYYSHVDGDGWRNLTEIEEYREKRPTLSAEVLLKEVFEPYNDLPVTVAPIVGDLDPDWYGDEEANQVARAIFRLPHVEAGSHIYSHPFIWGFFADGSAGKEDRYLDRYPARPGELGASWLLSLLREEKDKKIGNSEATASVRREVKKELARAAGIEEQVEQEDGEFDGDFERPRAYAIELFDLALEIKGALDYIDRLLPPGKRASVVQWSGNTLPFEAALRETRLANASNINGGDTRFDREFPSYAWVAPIGRQVGPEWQIYASNSNENTYTDLWTGRFFGFQHLVRTLDSTETPYRVKPFNVYYHMYSGEKLASLGALKRNLDYARSRKLAPVTTSQYASIAQGFYSTRFIALGENSWRVEDRGVLQTIRFDRATLLAVDFARSEWVIGQLHYQGSLYVALDPVDAAPILTLRPIERTDIDPPSPTPYLVEARWQVWDLSPAPAGFDCNVQGFGPGEMDWWVPEPGTYDLAAYQDGTTIHRAAATAGADHRLHFTLPRLAEAPVRFTVRRR